MSKKRNFELGRRWQLGKLSADYKQHKKLKKTTGYLDEPTMHQRKRKVKKPTLRCKHEWGEPEKVDLCASWGYEVSACSKCKKRKVKFL